MGEVEKARGRVVQQEKEGCVEKVRSATRHKRGPQNKTKCACVKRNGAGGRLTGRRRKAKGSSPSHTQPATTCFCWEKEEA